MTPEAQKPFRLCDWYVEPLSGSIVGADGKSKHLEPKVMDVIVHLSRQAGKVVTREELLEAIWPRSVNADQQLTRAISELRRAFEDDLADPRYIATVHKRGYRLIPEVDPVHGGPSRDKARTSVSGPWRGRTSAALGLLLVIVYVGIQGFQEDSSLEEIRPSENSIAVLPFISMGGDPEYEYLSDGISEEILNLLARVPELKVIGRTSSFAFKDKSEDLRSIGRQLGVRHVLEGSVRRDDKRVRVTAQLIDASDGTHIWSDTFDHTLDNIFALEDEVAAAVVAALRLQVAAVPSRGRPTTNVEAYTAFLKGRLAINRLNWRVAASYLKSAVVLDPQFAEAFELLALCYWHWEPAGFDGGEAQKAVYSAAAEAIAIDPDLVFAQALHRAGNVGTPSTLRTLEAFERAYSIQPKNPWVLEGLVYLYTYVGYLEKSLLIAEEAADRDPLSLDANLDLFGAYVAADRMDDAVAVLELVNQIATGPTDWEWTIAGAYLANGDDEAAIRYFEALLHHYGYMDTAWVRETVTATRDPEYGRAALDRRIQEFGTILSENDGFYWKGELINWYLYFGYADRYMELLFEAYPMEDSWNYINEHTWVAHTFYRQGVLVQPDYMRLANRVEITEIWERHGPPDFCTANDVGWDCR